MAQVHTDSILTLEAREVDGVVTRVVRRVRITGLVDTDYRVLFTALAAVGLAAGSGLSGATDLVLKERNPKLVDDRVVDVDLVYEHALNKGQDMDVPHYGFLVGETKSAVNQVKSNRHGQNGEAITLQHTYPGPSSANPDPDFPGQTKVQGGEIEFMQPETVISVKGIKHTQYPWIIQRHIEGGINSTPWGGHEVGTWLCTTCSYKPYGGSASRFEFTIEFQYKPEGWNPVAVFIDERTGKPPPNLVAGVGYKTIEKQRLVDFESVFGVRFLGG